MWKLQGNYGMRILYDSPRKDIGNRLVFMRQKHEGLSPKNSDLNRYSVDYEYFMESNRIPSKE